MGNIQNYLTNSHLSKNLVRNFLHYEVNIAIPKCLKGTLNLSFVYLKFKVEFKVTSV